MRSLGWRNDLVCKGILRPIRWKERTNSHRLSSDFHMCVMTCMSYIHLEEYLIFFDSFIHMYSIFFSCVQFSLSTPSGHPSLLPGRLPTIVSFFWWGVIHWFRSLLPTGMLTVLLVGLVWVSCICCIAAVSSWAECGWVQLSHLGPSANSRS